MIKTKIGDFSLEARKYRKGTCIFIVKKSYGMRVQEDEITINRPCPRHHVWLAQTGPHMLVLRKLERSGCIQRLKGDRNLIVKDSIAYRLSRFIGEASIHFEDMAFASKQLGISLIAEESPATDTVKEEVIENTPAKEEIIKKEEEVIPVQEKTKPLEKVLPKATSSFFKRVADILDEDDD